MKISTRPFLFLFTFFAADAQLKILAPRDLQKAYPKTHGMIYGTTATFGAPFYGQRVLGQLLYGKSKGEAHCSVDDYELPPPKRRPDPSNESDTNFDFSAQEQLVNIVLVRRGECSFVTKVKVAQDKGAHAVVVVDRESSSLTSEDIQQIVMADDGWGDAVHIPSLLVSRFDGNVLFDAVANGPVIVELAWDIPRGQVVLVDFWMSSGSLESMRFLERFRDSADALRTHLQFVPHYHIFSLPEGTDATNLCIDSQNKFCAPDPDGLGPVTGGDVVNEDVRQLCIWNTTARRPNDDSDGALYSALFWDYITSFTQKCDLEATSDGHRFGEMCSKQAMLDVGLDVGQVLGCVEQNRVSFLQEQLRSVAWSGQALRINGWRYSGPLEPETVLTAVCSGFPTAPAECNDLLTGERSRVRILPSAGLSFSTFLSSLLFVVCTMFAGFLIYKRHITSSVRQVLREEVMLEVQSQMADYAPLEDGQYRPTTQRLLSF